MKVEGSLFIGCAVFFAGSDIVYWYFSKDPTGTVALALIVNAESARELDDLITSLPVWSRMETEVTPLTSFDGRMQSLLPRLESLKAQAREIGMSAPGGGR